MGSANDPIYVKVSTHTQSPDGTTRNETFYMTSALNSYSAQLAANVATPIYTMVMAEQAAAGRALGATPQYNNDTYLGTASGGQVSLKTEIGIGFAALATPTRYSLVKQDSFATPLIGGLASGGQVIYNWIDGLLQQLTPFYLYQGVVIP